MALLAGATTANAPAMAGGAGAWYGSGMMVRSLPSGGPPVVKISTFHSAPCTASEVTLWPRSTVPVDVVTASRMSVLGAVGENWFLERVIVVLGAKVSS